jgi:hypothetical protein
MKRQVGIQKYENKDMLCNPVECRTEVFDNAAIIIPQYAKWLAVLLCDPDVKHV